MNNFLIRAVAMVRRWPINFINHVCSDYWWENILVFLQT